MTKVPASTEKSKKQRDNLKTPLKTLITHQLRIDLGRSVGVTTATPLVWLNGPRALNPRTDRNSRVIKSTCIYKFVNNHPYRD